MTLHDLVGPQQDQGTGFYREVGLAEWSYLGIDSWSSLGTGPY